jgi:putative transposase
MNRADHSIATMCRVLEVSPSGYYAWRTRTPSRRARQDAALTGKIRRYHARSRGTYGAPRILRDLREEAGERVAQKRVARLMRDAGLRGVHRRRFVTTTRRNERQRPAPDRVDREFAAARPDELWVADITYVPTWTGFLFLAVVIDVFSRRVVGWAMDTHMRTSLVLSALQMAVAQRTPHGTIHHSDQGSQYTSLAFGEHCRAAGIATSMGSVGDCYDNAMAESFFATLECELLERRSMENHGDARQAIFEYIEGWYNPHRRHSGIDFQSPANYERRYFGQPPRYKPLPLHQSG